MRSWLAAIRDSVVKSGAIVRVVVVRADGSTPREAGAAMQVSADGLEGTIGGGTLELECIAAARVMLAKHSRDEPEAKPGWVREIRDYPLGPSLGQCCGGVAKVLFELFTRAELISLDESGLREKEARLVLRPVESGVPSRLLAHRKEGYADLPLSVLKVSRDMLSGARPASAAFIPGMKGAGAWFVEPISCELMPLYLYGAGHVGRALVRVLEGLPFAVTWIDTSEDRFPAEVEPCMTHVAARDPAGVAAQAPEGAFHLVMTYSHPLDLAICHAVLKRGHFGFLGLIGSETKRARFIKRLRELGHGQAAIDRLICPIGITGLPGKAPAIIAVSTAAQLLQVAASLRTARTFGASEASR